MNNEETKKNETTNLTTETEQSEILPNSQDETQIQQPPENNSNDSLTEAITETSQDVSPAIKAGDPFEKQEKEIPEIAEITDQSVNTQETNNVTEEKTEDDVVENMKIENSDDSITVQNQLEEVDTVDTVQNSNLATEEKVEHPTSKETKPETQDQSKPEESPAKNEEYQSPKQKYFDEIFTELKEKINSKETIEIEVKARIRGGLRVHYKELPMFLPTSHFTLKRNPSEEEMQASIGQTFNVLVHEYQEFDEGRKAVIVSRKKLLLDEVWNKIQIGDIIEGKVSSIASFGVFVEFEGVEGLIHISRLSKIHIDDPNRFFKKGQSIQAKIIDINKEKSKIALSRKELEESPWKSIEEKIKPETQVKGIVRRLTDFGAYVELKPGVDGLLRNSELSWTKRVKRPSEILSPGQEIIVEILSISEEKENASLSYKRTQPNPWNELSERFKIGSEYEGTVLQVIPQGAIVNIAEGIDGFMPRSKMRPIMKGKNIPFKSGDKIDVIISDLNPQEESLILAPKVNEGFIQKSSGEKHSNNKLKTPSKSTFSLGDMLSEKEIQKLSDMNK
ncbi:S1 RNA-binding domain-containing protein [Bacteroidota bacterium]